MNKSTKIILSVLIIALFYIIFTISSDITKINQNFDHIKINHLIPIIATYVLVMFVSSLRQKFILKKLGIKINIKDSFLLSVAGLSMIITPLGSGQAIKTYYMKKKYGYKISKTFPLIVIERFSDLVIVSSLVLFSLSIYFSEIALIISSISFIILGIFVFSLSNKKIFNSFKKILQKIPFMAQLFEESNEIDTDIKNLLKFRIISISLIFTLIAVLLESLIVYFAFNIFNIELPFLEIVQIFYTSIIGGALSLIPGGVGLTEVGFVSLLIQKNIPIDLATSLIIFIRMTTIWFATILGFIFSMLILKKKSKRLGKIKIFDNAITWEFFRILLDLIFGLYKNRFEKISKEWKIKNDLSILDIGCGIGQYSKITSSRYVGIDLNCKYIDYCKKKFVNNKNKIFRCEDVTLLLGEKETYDIVLIVDFLHHIPNDLAEKILKIASSLANQYIICFEPILEQDHPIGKWIISNDEGNYIRPLNELHKLFENINCQIIDSSELKIGPIKSRAILAVPKIQSFNLDSSQIV